MPDDKRGRLLIVEDEPIVALSLESLFDAEGYAVIGPAGSVAGAMALIDSSSVDAAILDVSLRGEKVYAVADHLAALEIPYLFVTGHSSDILPQSHRNAPVVTKPYAEADLVTRVNALMKVHA